MTKQLAFSRDVLAKADEYLAAGRVRRDPYIGGVYWVRGSDPRRHYRVQTDARPGKGTAEWIACTCKHGVNVGTGPATCSHAVAVLVAVRDRIDLEDQ